MRDRARANFFPPKRSKIHRLGAAMTRCRKAETDAAFGLVLGSARPCNPGDGHGDIGVRALQCPARHSLGDLFTDRAVRLD